MTVEITRRIEFDAGHRIPNHRSKCRNVHGHRYVLEATVAGPVSQVAGDSSEGMVVDFGDLKAVMVEKVSDLCDHAFLVYAEDTAMIEALRFMKSQHVVLPFVPTAENLARWMFEVMAEELATRGLRLVRVVLHETPNGRASYGPGEVVG